jgi:mersacidin/lichenicidin family type 2 lantibiotic
MKIDIVRAWKDPVYRKTLTSEQLANLPPHPAGINELSDDELQRIAGGKFPLGITGTCPDCPTVGDPSVGLEC